jgi:hypothetical protein
MKIRPVGAELLHLVRGTDWQTGNRRTGMTKLIAAIRNLEKVPKITNTFFLLFNEQRKLYINIQSVPRSKHTPSQLWKPVS